MTTTTGHWTHRSPEDFLYSIAADFIEQLRAKMKKLHMTQSKLARSANVSKSYVSQVFNDPGNLSLVTIVKFANAVGMKVSLVGYEDHSPAHAGSGPINSEIFRLCWEAAGKPADMWDIQAKPTVQTTAALDVYLRDGIEWGWDVFRRTGNNQPRNHTGNHLTQMHAFQVIDSKNTESSVQEVHQ